MTAPLRRVLVRPPQPADAARWREYGWRAEPEPRRGGRRARGAARDPRGRGRRGDRRRRASAATRTRSTPTTRCSSASAAPSCCGPGKDGRLGEPDALEDDLAAGRHPGRRPHRGAGNDRRRRHALARPRDAARRPRLPHERRPASSSSQAAVPRRRGALVRSAALERPRRGDAPDEPDLAARRRSRARLPAARARAAAGAAGRARDPGRRGAGRGVRDDGPERARARPASRARARGERRDAPPDGGRRRRGAHLRAATRSRARATAARPA